jgi:hypothetical protein
MTKSRVYASRGTLQLLEETWRRDTGGTFTRWVLVDESGAHEITRSQGMARIEAENQLDFGDL